MRALKHRLDGLIAQLGAYDRQLPDTVRLGLARGVCRRATIVSQVMDEIALPGLVAYADRRQWDESSLDWDLIRLIVAELHRTTPEEVTFHALVEGLHRHLKRRRRAEFGAEGLWKRSAARGFERGALSELLNDRLETLDGAADWLPLDPVNFETLRSSVPPGAVKWDPCSPAPFSPAADRDDAGPDPDESRSVRRPGSTPADPSSGSRAP